MRFFKKSQNNEKDLGIYISNPANIARDYKKLAYKDLIKILNLNQEKMHNKTYEASYSFLLELIQIKNQQKLARTNKWLVGVTIFLVIATILGTLFLPYWTDKKELKNKTRGIYNSIIANEDIFITNINNIDEFKKTVSINTLPRNYIQQEIDPIIRNEIQKRFGVVNYQFFLYYIEQTNSLNSIIDELKTSFLKNGAQSQETIKYGNYYLELMNYLSKEGWKETKFNHLIDTECLVHLMRLAFPFIKDLRSEKAECRDESVNRIYYYFGGYIETDTPNWMKPLLKRALEERGLDASFIN